MKIHPREELVAKAALEVLRTLNAHDLTDGEQIRVMGDLLSGIAKYMIRGERHPYDPMKGGGEE